MSHRGAAKVEDPEGPEPIQGGQPAGGAGAGRGPELPAMGQIYMGYIPGSVPARRSFGAANAALNVFNSLSTGMDVCVLSNGVPLERQ
jgi:hypothetical protein